MVLGRAYQPPERRPMELACHHLETMWQEKTTRETSQAVERRPRPILERHDMAAESTRQGNLETACWGLRPTTGHNGCLMMMNDDVHHCQKSIWSYHCTFSVFQYRQFNALIRGYKSFVRPLLEYYSTVWNPFIHAKYYQGMTGELKNIQRYFTRRIYYRCLLDCKHDYPERINHLQLESLELRRIYNDMAMIFKIVHKFINLKYSDLLTMFNTTRNSVTTRGHAFKLKTRSFRLDVARNHFCNRVVPLWNSLPAYVVNKRSPLLFKAALRNIDFTRATKFTRNL